ncbi:MAG TPA: T9SS type A sorting domain-containing protein, partial [Candidatus Krumholzibacteria bacterium]|nr:T9SS type A sorting domain-containing protein [Candidatus Krumholzibacteria bacterium]
TIKEIGEDDSDPELVWSGPTRSVHHRSAELMQNVPNPFNPRTSIPFSLDEEGWVRLDVFDVTGRLVATLVDGVRPAGRHTINMDASSLASGAYFYRLRAGGVVQQKKMILLK